MELAGELVGTDAFGNRYYQERNGARDDARGRPTRRWVIYNGEVEASKVPADYQRRQTLKNVERYVTPELKEYEAKIMGAEERMQAVVASAGGTIRPLEELFVMPLLEPLVRSSTALAPGAAPPGYYIHELGGAPMGSSEATGVVNRWNQLWRTPNLLVTDGSCWPSAGWQSPTLTEMALTWRACDHAAAALKRGEL